VNQHEDVDRGESFASDVPRTHSIWKRLPLTSCQAPCLVLLDPGTLEPAGLREAVRRDHAILRLRFLWPRAETETGSDICFVEAPDVSSLLVRSFGRHRSDLVSRIRCHSLVDPYKGAAAPRAAGQRRGRMPLSILLTPCDTDSEVILAT
jgi:hypothetical protein